MDENDDKTEDMILIASALAVELARGKCVRDIIRIRSVINQISCTLSTIIAEKCEKK